MIGTRSGCQNGLEIGGRTGNSGGLNGRERWRVGGYGNGGGWKAEDECLEHVGYG